MPKKKKYEISWVITWVNCFSSIEVEATSAKEALKLAEEIIEKENYKDSDNANFDHYFFDKPVIIK